MFEINDISLEEKEYIESFLKKQGGTSSEFSFTNLFIWRKRYDIKYAIISDMLCILPKHIGGPRSVTFPMGITDEKSLKSTIESLLEWFLKNGEKPLIRLYNEESVKMLLKVFPDKFIITEDRDNFEYIYSSDALINLPGKKYHSKRNHINKFRQLYGDFEFKKLSVSDADECIALFDKWLLKKDDEAEGLDEEREATIELLKNIRALDVFGGGIYVNKKLIAFSFGEKMSDDTVLIHLEHADTDYDGSFQVINQQFCENLCSEFKYINREEDMGIPGMRKVKESYHPIFMEKKYVASLK